MSLQSYHLAWLQAHPEHSAEWLESKLREGFHVHHIDWDHSNDAPGNLVLMFGADHMALHGMKNAPRKFVRKRKERATETPKAYVSRSHASPAEYQRSGAHFRDWQAFMGLNNALASKALGISPNSLAEYRKAGAPLTVAIAMTGLAIGADLNLSFPICEKLKKVNRIIRDREAELIPRL
jgi:hypothetical protein